LNIKKSIINWNGQEGNKNHASYSVAPIVSQFFSRPIERKTNQSHKNKNQPTEKKNTLFLSHDKL
jgi:hypothetical protein